MGKKEEEYEEGDEPVVDEAPSGLRESHKKKKKRSKKATLSEGITTLSAPWEEEGRLPNSSPVDSGFFELEAHRQYLNNQDDAVDGGCQAKEEKIPEMIENEEYEPLAEIPAPELISNNNVKKNGGKPQGKKKTSSMV